jgi:hypothetical protein
LNSSARTCLQYQQSGVYLLTAFSADTHFFTIIELQHFNPSRFNAFVAKQHDIRTIERRWIFNDPALAILGRRTGVAFDHIDILNQYAPLFTVHFEDFTDFAAIFSGNDLDFVILLNMDFIPMHRALLHR